MFTDSSNLRNQFRIRTITRPTEPSQDRATRLGEDPQGRKTGAVPQHVLRRGDTGGLTETTLRRQWAMMSLDGHTPAHNLTLMASSRRAKITQAPHKSSRSLHPRRARKGSIPTRRREPFTKQTRAPHFTEVVGKGRGKTQRTRSVPSVITKTNLTQRRDGAPKAPGRPSKTGKKRRRDKSLGSTSRTPLMET